MEETPEVFKDIRAQVALVGFTTGAFIGGTVLGYILGKRKGTVIEMVPAEPDEDNQLSIDFAEAEVGTPVAVVIPIEEYRALQDAVEDDDDDDDAPVNSTTPYVGDEPEEPMQLVTVQRSVFSETEDQWDYEDELNVRTPEVPYVIHKDEFLEDEMNFAQDTVTYYVGDDTMVDGVDNPIYNYAELMGELKFGHGSQDENIVYIRNEKRKREWEVLRDEGHYAIEVLGHEMDRAMEEDELRHSAVPKFRRE